MAGVPEITPTQPVVAARRGCAVFHIPCCQIRTLLGYLSAGQPGLLAGLAVPD